MKKLLAILCAVMLVLTCSISVFAAGPYTITVTNAENGKTYSAYKMLNLVIDGDVHKYTVADDWEAFFTGTGAGAAYVNIVDGIVTWKGEDANKIVEAAALAAAAITYAKENSLTPATSGIAGDIPLVLTVTELGYYLVDSNLGSICAINTTTTTNVEVTEKNTVPTVDKVIDEDGGVDENTAMIGESIPFKSTITVNKGLEALTWVDTLSAGLTYNGGLTIAGLDVDTDYTISVAGQTITVEFKSSYLENLSTSTDIVITYSATLNENAIISDTGNLNTVKIIYGNEPNKFESEIIGTTTYTYSFDLVKTDANNKLLAGAGFKLYTDEECTDAKEVKLVKIDVNTYRVAKTGEEGVAIITNANNPITVQGLENGKYYLKETTTPDGYNPLTEAREIEIDGANITTDMEGIVWENEDGGVHIVNNSGSMLPETGGMGTTLFIAIGSIVVLITGVVLVARKRMSKYVA